jgi:hypothetical protein
MESLFQDLCELSLTDTKEHNDYNKPIFGNGLRSMWLAFENGNYFISCYHIYKELDNTAAKNHILAKCKKLQYSKQFLIPSFQWNSNSNSWDIYGVDKISSNNHKTKFPYIPISKLDDFILPIINKGRKTKSQKQKLLNKFNLYHLHPQLKIPIECSLLDDFSKSCPFAIELQYKLDKYRLDAFIPRLKIAIEIDENGHSNYNKNEEKVYESFLRDLHIVLIRFDPTKQTSFDLIKEVWKRTLSPDFKIFRLHENL